MESEDGCEVKRKQDLEKIKCSSEDNEKKQLEKIPYPKSTFFISSNEFCERFCYYGLRTILSIHLTEYLLYSEKDATVIYHTFIMLAYFFPIIGAVVADSYFGKFNTTFYVSMVYALGCTILSLSSVTPLNLPHRTFALLGLFGIALGTGGIKPCIVTLGADQFILPEQEKYLSTFYGIFYICINIGSLISTTITPLLRKNVHCFGEDTCFPLAFGMSAVLMVGAIVTIGIGKPYFRHVPPSESLIIKVVKCIASAIKGKCSRKSAKVDHWLDYASDNFSLKLIEDLKQTLKVLLLFVPFPVAWALIDQTGSGWTFQARRMYSDLGFYVIPADQMQILIPFFYMLLIPVFQYGIYPIFDKLSIFTTLLQKVALGGVLIGLSFVCSAGVSLALEGTYPELPSQGVGHLRIYNNLPCNVKITCPDLNENNFEINQGDYYENTSFKLKGNKSLPYNLSSKCGNDSGSINIYEDTSVGYYFQNLKEQMFLDDVSKPVESFVRVRTLVSTIDSNDPFVKVTFTNSGGTKVITSNSSDHGSSEITFGTYNIRIGNSEIETKLFAGGVYAILAATTDNSNFDIISVEVMPPNSVHILWLVPQYFVMAAGELLFSIPAVEFAYTQSPISMKSIVMACWLLTTAFGNLIVVLISAASFFSLASNNFFMYAILMFLDMVIFYFMTRRYTYVVPEKS